VQRRSLRYAVSISHRVENTLLMVAPNPSIERTSSSKLRLLPAAAHVER